MVDFSPLFQALEARGYSPVAAAGLTGNFAQESNGNAAVIGDQGTSGGLGQWHAGRFASLQRFAQANGQRWQNPAVQVAFADQEIRANPNLFHALQTATSPVQAADLVSARYERPNPAYANNAHREQVAAQVFGGPGPTAERAQSQFGAVGLPSSPATPSPAATLATAPNNALLSAPPATPGQGIADLAAKLTGGLAGAAGAGPPQGQAYPPAPVQQADPRALAASLLAGTHGNLVLQ